VRCRKNALRFAAAGKGLLAEASTRTRAGAATISSTTPKTASVMM
jgi:hypothetical protein